MKIIRYQLLSCLFILSICSFKIEAQVVINEYSCANIWRYKYEVDSFFIDTTLWDYKSICLASMTESLTKDPSDTTGYWEYWSYREVDSSYFFLADYFGGREDWIELFNQGDEEADISGFYLSDKDDNPYKYTIPDNTIIPAQGYKLFFASGRDTVVEGQVHTNFKLTQGGGNAEHILFSASGGARLDQLAIVPHQAHHSMARNIDGTGDFTICTLPTPDSSNNNAPFAEKYLSRPVFDVEPGFYTTPVIVTISYEASEEIVYYTLDGSEPDTSAMLYEGAISIDSTRVLKARAFPITEGHLPGQIRYATYFIDEQHTLPVLSLAASSLDSLANGIKELRPWGSIEYFDAFGERKANAYGEYNSHGQDSWILDQRSLDFVGKDQLGYKSKVREKLFADSDRRNFQKLILRAAGDDNYPATTKGVKAFANEGSANLRDAYFHNLCLSGGMNLDVRRGAKCVIYINGMYWGVYDIRENPDDHDYTKYYYDQGEYDLQYLLTWGETWPEYGGEKALQDWRRLRQFILSNSMSDQENFDQVLTEFDAYSLADYVIAHSMSVSSDWLNYNVGWWRGLDPDGSHNRWGYILWDNDASFAHYINYTEIPDTSATAAVCNVDHLTNSYSDPEKHISVLNKLRENEAFNQYYIMRYNDLMNTVFSCDNMLRQLDSLEALIEPEMHRHVERWPGGSFEEWKDNVAKLRYFIERRCGAMADSKLDSCYDLSGPYELTFDIEPREAGEISVNSLQINSFPWQASYFGGVGIALDAHPESNPQYYFANWTSENNSFVDAAATAENQLILGNDDEVIAVFSDEPVINLSTIFRGNGEAQLYPTITNEKTSLYISADQEELLDIFVISASGTVIRVFDGYKLSPNALHCLDIYPADLGLKPGMYIVNIRTSKGNQNLKFVYQEND